MKIIFIFLFILTIDLFPQIFDKYEDYGKILNKELNEISGIVSSRLNQGIIWMHNDSGNESYIYGINHKCELKAIIILNGANFEDAEDIAIGPGIIPNKDYIYLGDIGDNSGIRKNKTIYFFQEPIINSTKTIDTIKISNYNKINFNFDDGPRDAESLFIDPIDSLIIVLSKREDNVSAYYLKLSNGYNDTAIFNKLITLPFGAEGFKNSGVTGADMTFDGKELLIKNYSKVYYYQRENNETLFQLLSKPPIEAFYIQEPQGEAIAWEVDNSGYFTISEETVLKITPHLYHYKKILTSINPKKK